MVPFYWLFKIKAQNKVNYVINKEVANTVFEARICFPLCYTSLISVLNIKRTSRYVFHVKKELCHIDLRHDLVFVLYFQ